MRHLLRNDIKVIKFKTERDWLALGMSYETGTQQQHHWAQVPNTYLGNDTIDMVGSKSFSVHNIVKNNIGSQNIKTYIYPLCHFSLWTMKTSHFISFCRISRFQVKCICSFLETQVTFEMILDGINDNTSKQIC